MSLINDLSPLTRDACYVIIATDRCAIGALNGIAVIVDLILKEVFLDIENRRNALISKPLKDRVIEEIGKKLKSYITQQYITNMIALYRDCLSDLTTEELNVVAQKPTGDIFCSESHKKFHLREQLTVLPVKNQLIRNLQITGKTIVENGEFTKNINNIVSATTP